MYGIFHKNRTHYRRTSERKEATKRTYPNAVPTNIIYNTKIANKNINNNIGNKGPLCFRTRND